MPATSVAVMGSTGSIGTQTLEVAAARPDDFEVVALGAARSVDLLAEQATAFRPAVVAIADPSLGITLAERIPSGIEVLAGPDSLADAAQSAEVVINGVVGFAGLPVTLATLEAGRRLGWAGNRGVPRRSTRDGVRAPAPLPTPLPVPSVPGRGTDWAWSGDELLPLPSGGGWP